jgi:hypothetical protein
MWCSVFDNDRTDADEKQQLGCQPCPQWMIVSHEDALIEEDILLTSAKSLE